MEMLRRFASLIVRSISSVWPAVVASKPREASRPSEINNTALLPFQPGSNFFSASLTSTYGLKADAAVVASGMRSEFAARFRSVVNACLTCKCPAVMYVITQIKLLLVKRHDVTLDTADFTVTTQQDIISARESTTAAFRNLLAWVAGVSLIVGGIGIMNIMLVSVTERTREIGIRQAIGATPDDIRMQFLAEALLISIVGGLIGLVVGLVGSWLFGALSSMRTVIVPSSILLAFGSAATVGIFFGYYPANKAAQLDPIEALRYE